MSSLIKLILAGAIIVAIPTASFAQSSGGASKTNKEDCEKKGKGPGECGGG
jgi:hypothetical protein